MSFALGIDIGTSGIRTAVVDHAREVVSMARVAHLQQSDTRIDANLWWEAVKECLRQQTEALTKIDIDPLSVQTIAVDGTSGTMVLTGENLAPVSRALMYDSKGFEQEAVKISQHAPELHITRGSASALGRAMRLVSEAASADVRYLLHQADFIAAKLLGVGGLSDHNNALKTGFDPETERWPDWISGLIPSDVLPEPAPVGEPIGHLRAELANELGLSNEVVVHAGTTDSIAAFLAASPVVEGNAVTSIGSTLAVKLLSARRVDDPDIGLYSHRIGDFWLAGGASNTGGAVLAHYFPADEIKRLSGLIDAEKTMELAYYPLLQAGERFPINDPNLPPKVSPRPETDAEFLHALFEGIAAIEEQCYRAMAERGAGYPNRIFTAGGAAKNDTFTAIRQKLSDAPLCAAQQTEAAVGAALCSSVSRLL